MEEVQKNGSAKTPITWTGHEYLHFEKTSEWFWALGLISVAGSVTALIFGNVLFAILILIAAFVLAIFAAREPNEVTFTLSQRGLRIDDKMYPFKAFESFGIEEFSPNHMHKLILEPKHIYALSIIIPLEGVDSDEVHDFLLNFLPEEDHEEPLIHKIMEWLGF
jgi:hypothetical protein